MTPKKALQNQDKLLEIQSFKALRAIAASPASGEARLAIGDMVRIAKTKEAFHKGYEPGWSRELYRVVEIIHSTPVTYRVSADPRASPEAASHGEPAAM